MTLSITSAVGENHILISLEGDVDTKTAPELLAALTAQDLASATQLRLDIKGVNFMSSAGLRALIFSKQKMSHDATVYVIGANQEITDVITKTGLSTAVSMVASVDDI
jgi:anti-anti-sigma factor